MPEQEDFKMPPEWGVQLDPSIRWIDCADGKCINCGREIDLYDKEAILGFTHIVKDSPSHEAEECHYGTFIFKCACDTRYWRHGDPINISIFRKFPAKHNWPVDKNGEPF